MKKKKIKTFNTPTIADEAAEAIQGFIDSKNIQEEDIITITQFGNGNYFSTTLWYKAKK